jgi:hypothetical protein
MYSYEPSDLERRLRIIDDIVIPQPAPAFRAASATKKLPSAAKQDAALVLNDGIVSLKQGISDANSLDVLRTYHLADLWASQKYDKTKEFNRWIWLYIDTLKTVGWQFGISFEDSWRKGKRATPEETMLNLVLQAGGPVPEQLAAKSLAALPANPEAQNLFHQKTTTEASANFNLSPCIQNAKGDIGLTVTYLNSTRQTSATPWNLALYPSIKIQAVSMKLPNGAHDAFRELIEQKIRNISQNLFETIKL